MILAALLLLAATADPIATVPAPPLVTAIVIPFEQIPTEIASHSGAVWFVSWQNWPRKVEPYLGRMDLNGKFALNELLSGSRPGLLANGPAGSLWVSENRRERLWRVLPNGEIRFTRIDRRTIGIAVGADGAIWCTHEGSSSISSYNADGSLRGRWEVPERKGVAARPAWIAIGPDENIWFTDAATDTVGRISPKGEIKVFALPKGWRDPGEIVVHGGALWFGVANVALLARVTPAGSITSVKIHAPAAAVASGSEGRLWYAGGGAGIGWMEPDGATDHVLVTTRRSRIRSIAAGPDGHMWFVDETARLIGRVELPKK